MSRAVVSMLNAEGNALQLCSDHWPLRAGETSPWGVPALPLPKSEAREAGGGCSVLGVPYSERPTRELIPGPTQCGIPPPPTDTHTPSLQFRSIQGMRNPTSRGAKGLACSNQSWRM